MCGLIFNDSVVANCPHNVRVIEFCKSVNIYQDKWDIFQHIVQANDD